MADADATMSLAEKVDAALTPVSNFVSSIIFYSVPVGGVDLPLVVIWLMTAAVVLTVGLRFINVRGFFHAWKILFMPNKKETGDGQISHFQAMSSALSGTIGLGNIASVPIAIAIGGPGAVFWMIVAGFFGMASKFAECSMAVKYRKVQPDGTTIGGPMYYIEDVLARRGMKTFGKLTAMFFALMAMGGSVSLLQVNQSYEQISAVTGLDAPLTYGVIISSAVAFVILGGIKRIGNTTGFLVPFMGSLYVGAALIILIVNAGALPDAVMTIFRSAFGLEAAGGGFIGALINGIRRATYSNEAGVGSSAFAHSAVKTAEPMTEGYVALLEPFIDTIVICTMTALVIIVTGAYEPYLFADNIRGIEITSNAFESTFSWFPIVLMVSSTLFAFTTLVSWAFYGSQAAAYLFGPSRLVDVTFKLSLCAVLSLSAALSVSSIIDFIDSMLFAMAIPNILALYLLLPEIRRDLRAYEKKHGLR